MRIWLQCGKMTYIEIKTVGSSVKSHSINQERYNCIKKRLGSLPTYLKLPAGAGPASHGLKNI